MAKPAITRTGVRFPEKSVLFVLGPGVQRQNKTAAVSPLKPTPPLCDVGQIAKSPGGKHQTFYRSSMCAKVGALRRLNKQPYKNLRFGLRILFLQSMTEVPSSRSQRCYNYCRPLIRQPSRGFFEHVASTYAYQHVSESGLAIVCFASLKMNQRIPKKPKTGTKTCSRGYARLGRHFRFEHHRICAFRPRTASAEGTSLVHSVSTGRRLGHEPDSFWVAQTATPTYRTENILRLARHCSSGFKKGVRGLVKCHRHSWVNVGTK